MTLSNESASGIPEEIEELEVTDSLGDAGGSGGKEEAETFAGRRYIKE